MINLDDFFSYITKYWNSDRLVYKNFESTENLLLVKMKITEK